MTAASSTSTSAAISTAAASVVGTGTGAEPETAAAPAPAIRAVNVGVYYGDNKVIEGVSMDLPEHEITAIIGPSGAGKSTLLRCINRMNDLIEIFRMEGEMWFGDFNLYAPNSDPTQIRYRIGMVFQRPNPFPKSIYENVAFGPRINGYAGRLEDIVEESLRAAALWDEVKDRLKESALALSGGQQQRLCIARALAVRPSVILMDEPCSALDPIATLAIEELMQELKQQYIMITVLMEAALITPPIGVNLYVVQGIRMRGGHFNDVAYGALPFVVSMMVMVGLLLAYEDLALWLPTLVYR